MLVLASSAQGLLKQSVCTHTCEQSRNVKGPSITPSSFIKVTTLGPMPPPPSQSGSRSSRPTQSRNALEPYSAVVRGRKNTVTCRKDGQSVCCKTCVQSKASENVMKGGRRRPSCSSVHCSRNVFAWCFPAIARRGSCGVLRVLANGEYSQFNFIRHYHFPRCV